MYTTTCSGVARNVSEGLLVRSISGRRRSAQFRDAVDSCSIEVIFGRDHIDWTQA